VTTTNAGDGGEFHRMHVDWQDSITWNTATANGTPGLQAAGAEAAVAFESAAGINTLDQDVPTGTNDIDVTRDVQAWANGAANFGWAILPWINDPSSSSGSVNGQDAGEFNQSENATAGNRPRLTVEWLPSTTPSVSFQ
jgi:hypothetical protein